MSKKIVVGFIACALIFGGVFTSVSAQQITFAQLIELLISTGVIAPDKATAARSVVSSTSSTQSPVVPTTQQTIKNIYHSADTNKDWKISDSELARVTELYSYKSSNVRTGEYSSAVGTVDGYQPGVGSRTTDPHSADTNKDWKLAALEYSRVVELKNAPGGYAIKAGTEDGFEPISSSSGSGSSVDLRINGMHSISVLNSTTVKVSWNATSTQAPVRSCVGTGSVFGIEGGGSWGTNGSLAASGDAKVLVTTMATLPASFNVGIQCTLSNGTVVSDMVPVTITGTQTVSSSISIESPKGPVVWTEGSTQIIRWSSIGLDATQPVEISLQRKSPSDNQFWFLNTIAKTQPGSGSYSWKVSDRDIDGRALYGSQYKILVGRNLYKGDGPVANSEPFKIINQTLVAAPVKVTYPLDGQTFVAGKNIDVSFTNPIYGERYTVYLRGKAYDYALGKSYIDVATDQKKNTFLLPPSVPTDATQFNIVIVNAAGVDVASSGAINITNPTTVTVPTTVNTVNGITIGYVPLTVAPGTSFSVTVKNTGTKPWGNSHDIGLVQGSTNLQFVNLNGVSAGGLKTVTFTAPATVGTYTIRALEQNVAWFGDTKAFSVVVPTTTVTPTVIPPVSQQVVAPSISATTWDVNNSATWPTISTPSTLTANQSIRAKLLPGGSIHLYTQNNGVNSGKITNPGSAGAYQLSMYVYDYSISSTVAEQNVNVVITNSANVGPTIQSCSGMEPVGGGISKGGSTYTTGYGTTQWTFVTGVPGACQWTCVNGYSLSGNSCAITATAAPAYPTYQLCGGTEPSSSVATKGSGSYSTGYGTRQWTFVTTNPGACQYMCANGASWNGATCAIPVANQVNGINISNPGTINVGSSFTVTVTNTGTKPWGNSHDIGLSTADGSTNLQFINVSGVAVGESKTITFTAPTAAGNYIIRAVEQGVEWFGGSTSITVSSEGATKPTSSNLGAAIVGLDRVVNFITSWLK